MLRDDGSVCDPAPVGGIRESEDGATCFVGDEDQATGSTCSAGKCQNSVGRDDREAQGTGANCTFNCAKSGTETGGVRASESAATGEIICACHDYHHCIPKWATHLGVAFLIAFVMGLYAVLDVAICGKGMRDVCAAVRK